MANVLGELFGEIAYEIKVKRGDDPETVTYKPAEFAEKIKGIEVGGGGSSADVRYVTFMSYDGSVEYGKKAVAVGDDCADPIARGVFSTPTRESTVQYNYDFAGWATTANGALNANWNKAVTEDRTVYANFAAILRYYTITYLDTDGSVLKTESLVYGSMPRYTPVKVGSTFNGWMPELTEVAGDASYTAQWIAKMDINALTWEQIAEYSRSGEAANVFAIGDAKTFSAANYGTVTARIIGFNHDDLADGSGKAGITFECDTPLGNQYFGKEAPSFGGNGAAAYKTDWGSSIVRQFWNDTGSGLKPLNMLPTDLRAVIKQVKKRYWNLTNSAIETTDDLLWMLSMSELGVAKYSVSQLPTKDEGGCYAAYTPNKSTDDSGTWTSIKHDDLKKAGAQNATTAYFTRSKYTSGTGSVWRVLYNDGTLKTDTQSGSSNTFAFPCFCI